MSVDLEALKRLRYVRNTYPGDVGLFIGSRLADDCIAALERAERVEAAAWYGLEHDDGSTPWWDELRAALAAAPEDSGAAFERYLAERFPTPEARAEFDAKVEEVNRAAAPEGSGRMLAYQGKDGCTSPLCTRLSLTDFTGPCYGWHCARCHEPCSYQGHASCVPAPEGSDGYCRCSDMPPHDSGFCPQCGKPEARRG